MKGDIEYIDCGSSIWMTKEHWEKLKKWFKDSRGGIELEEYNKRPVQYKKAKAKK